MDYSRYATPDNWFNGYDDGGNLVQYLADGQNGNRLLTQADIDAFHSQIDQRVADAHQGVINAGGVWNTTDPFSAAHPGEENSNRYTRPQGVPDSWRLYAAEGGQGMYWGPADWEKPNHNDGFFQKDAYDPRAIISEMPGLPLLLAPLAGAAAGAGAGADSSLATTTGTFTGNVGADGLAYGGYGAAGAGAAGAAGTVANTSGAETVAGSGANDTLGGSTMFDDPYGLGVDQYGNSTGQYANYGDPNVSYADQGDPGSFGNNGTSLSDFFNYGKQGLALANQYKGLIGAGVGALAGRAGGSKPAGTTTTTTTGDPAIMPYIQGNLAGAYTTLQGINPNNPLLPASQNEAMKTIRGDYLNPNSNPYFASSVNDALGQAGSTYVGLYGGPAGQNMGNSGFQEGLSRGLGAVATNAYNTNYQTERGRQATMAAGAPSLVSQSNAAMFSPNQSFAGLIPGFTSTSVPYFQNNLGNMFSGALGGYALSQAAGK